MTAYVATSDRASCPAMTTHPTDLIDPAARLEEIRRIMAFDANRALLGLVSRHPQRATAAVELWTEPPVDERERTDLAEDALRRLGLPEFDRTDFNERPLVVPVIVLDGPCWWSIDVQEVLLGLRYGNNRFQSLHTSPYVVNRHGWYDAFDGAAGTSPSAAFRRRHIRAVR